MDNAYDGHDSTSELGVLVVGEGLVGTGSVAVWGVYMPRRWV